MVCKVPAYKGNDGKLYASEEEACCADVRLAIRAYQEQRGTSPRNPSFAQAVLDDPLPLTATLVSLIGVRQLNVDRAETPDQKALLRRLQDGECRPTASDSAIRHVPIHAAIYRGVQ